MQIQYGRILHLDIGLGNSITQHYTSFSGGVFCHISCCLFFTVALSWVTCAEGLIRASGYEGKEVQVSCSYGQGYESYEKYLCRNDCGNADVLITTTETKKNRYSIHDDKRKRVFTATISGLSRMDAGQYWCGVTRNGKDIYTEVKLEVGQGRQINK